MKHSSKKTTKTVKPKTVVKKLTQKKPITPKPVKSTLKTSVKSTAKTKITTPTKRATKKLENITSKITPKKVAKTTVTKPKVAVKTKLKVTPKKQATQPKKITTTPRKKLTVKVPKVEAKITNAAKQKIVAKPKTRKTVITKTQPKTTTKTQPKPAQKTVPKTKPQTIEKVVKKTNIIKNKTLKSSVKETIRPKKVEKKKISVEVKKTENGNFLYEKNVRQKRGRRKIIKPISSAVFRGKRLNYDFDVFDLKEKFEDFPAVFVISRRKIDKEGKGHHKIVCIGQTEMLGEEIVKHKKMACIKKCKANVVSILKDNLEKNRITIEENLRTQYGILCSHKLSEKSAV